MVLEVLENIHFLPPYKEGMRHHSHLERRLGQAPQGWGPLENRESGLPFDHLKVASSPLCQAPHRSSFQAPFLQWDPLVTGEKGGDRRTVLGTWLADHFHLPRAQDCKSDDHSGSVKFSPSKARASHGSRNRAHLSNEGRDALADTCCGKPWGAAG